MIAFSAIFVVLNAACIAWLLELGETEYVWINVVSLVVNLASVVYGVVYGWDYD